MSYYVYIISSNKLKKRYIGLTSNLKRRIYEHKKGFSNFTKSANDWRLIYYECFTNKLDAQTEENFFKSGQGRERLKYLLQHGEVPEWSNGTHC